MYGGDIVVLVQSVDGGVPNARRGAVDRRQLTVDRRPGP